MKMHQTCLHFILMNIQVSFRKFLLKGFGCIIYKTVSKQESTLKKKRFHIYFLISSPSFQNQSLKQGMNDDDFLLSVSTKSFLGDFSPNHFHSSLTDDKVQKQITADHDNAFSFIFVSFSSFNYLSHSPIHFSTLLFCVCFFILIFFPYFFPYFFILNFLSLLISFCLQFTFTFLLFSSLLFLFLMFFFFCSSFFILNFFFLFNSSFFFYHLSISFLFFFCCYRCSFYS